LQEQLALARVELQDLQSKHMTLIETSSNQIKTYAETEAAAQSQTTATHNLYFAEARAAAEARLEAAAKAVELDLALSAAETLLQRMTEMQDILRGSEAVSLRIAKNEQSSSSPSDESSPMLRHEISPIASVCISSYVYIYIYIYVHGFYIPICSRLLPNHKA
jgi:hypothetical protein